MFRSIIDTLFPDQFCQTRAVREKTRTAQAFVAALCPMKLYRSSNLSASAFACRRLFAPRLPPITRRGAAR
jgi:hypothetical protein